MSTRIEDELQLWMFAETVWQWYAKNGRHELPWRQPGAAGFDPYRIMVSEIMLQQTQVGRVIPKYEAFLRAFPDTETLARSELGEVLVLWQGLGYNRRAKFLWQAAKAVVGTHAGIMPRTVAELTKLPGVGVNTAGAIVAYAYDEPVVFIETNIRTVFIHHFFADASEVADRDITELVRQTLPEQESTREWYWALMDYGSHLKRTVGNLNVRSRTYTRQSTFQGSRRQLRGAVLRMLGEGPKTLEAFGELSDERLPAVLEDLLREELIRFQDDQYSL